MTTQTVEYKAKAFELRNLGYFFLMVFGFQALKYGFSHSSGEGLSALSAGPGVILDLLGSWGPIIAAFVVTAITEGKSGIGGLWRRFWNRNMSIKWLLVALLIIPTMELVSNLVSRMLNGQAYPFLNLPGPPWMVISDRPTSRSVLFRLPMAKTDPFCWPSTMVSLAPAPWTSSDFWIFTFS